MPSKNSSNEFDLYHQSTPAPVQPLLGSDSVVVLSKTYFQQFRKLNKTSQQYRNSRTGARSIRTQIDHDVFEGLPVRHWRKKPIKVDTAPEKENVDETDSGKMAWKELQMPRDYQLLPQVSQDLLRAARTPQIKKQAVPLLEDEKELGEEEDADGEIDTGFVAKRWALLPKDLERPEPEFLAKRRKGLPSAHSGALGSLNTTGQMRKTKIRKIDTDGNSSVWEVLVPEGQTVDGEVVEEETSPIQAPAPGTVVEGVGIVNAEGLVIAGDQGVPGVKRRRPPPPNRKPRGPGRGRKKKVAFAGADGLPTSTVLDGTANSAIKIEDGKGIDGGQGAAGGDTEMGDDSQLKEGDQVGEEGSEDGSEEDEGEEGDREEGELSPSASPSRTPPKPPSPTMAEAISGLGAQPPLLPQSPSMAPRAIVTEPPMEHSTEAAVELEINPMDPHFDTHLNDPMDEILDVPTTEQMPELTDPMDEMLDEFTNDVVPQYPSVSAIDNVKESMIASATEIMVDGRSKAHTKDIATTLEAMDASPTQTTPQPPAETAREHIQEPTTVPSPSIVAEPTAYPTVEPLISTSISPAVEFVPEPAMGTIEEPATSPPAEPIVESVLGQTIGTVRESTSEAVPGATREATRGPVTGSEPRTESMAKQELEAMLEPNVVILPATAAQATMEPVADLFAYAPPRSVTEADAKPSPEPKNEPMDERTYDLSADAIQEHSERKYSLTRPTASPKAPTPSPPTPIETKFSSLQPPEGPYVSPKAPTMSPPTPIQRSMSSSPDIPLSGQPFQLPPQIDVVYEIQSALAPGMHQIPNADGVSVEAAPEVEPRVNAQLPFDHDPLDGMAEPGIADSMPGQEVEGDAMAHFSDGEEDLLGGLERSLGSRSYSS